MRCMDASSTGRALLEQTSDLAPVLARQLVRNDRAVLTPGATRTQVVDELSGLIRHVGVALETGRTALLEEYLQWAAAMAQGSVGPGSPGEHDVDAEADLATRAEGDARAPAHGLAVAVADARVLDALVEVAASRFAGGALDELRGLLDAAQERLDPAPPAPQPSLDPASPTGALGLEFLELLLAGQRKAAIARIVQAADDGMSLESLYLDVFQPCLWEVGRRWQLGTVTVAQEHAVTAATQLAMAQLYPRMFATPRVGYCVVVSSAGGELHELGGRMVADLFELRGWTSHFVGANTPGDGVAELAARTGADIVAVSATLPTHVPAVEETVAAIRTVSAARILVGGRPFNRVADLWRVVGADGTAANALDAVRVAEQLLRAA